MRLCQLSEHRQSPSHIRRLELNQYVAALSYHQLAIDLTMRAVGRLKSEADEKAAVCCHNSPGEFGELPNTMLTMGAIWADVSSASRLVTSQD